MNILFIGDIFAAAGRGIVARNLKRIVAEEQIDLAIANSENSAGGFGITPMIAEELFGLGIHVMTTGNHIWDKKEIYDYLVKQPRLLRPANYIPELPGKGLVTMQTVSGVAVAVMNVQGRVNMSAVDDPWRKTDELLASLDPSIKVRFLDFHAEATSEKVAMGWHLDGRVSAVIGTHTHIPTADERILPGGTAYLTDCGMTGPYDSVIGVDKDTVLRKFKTSIGSKMEAAKGMVELRAVVIAVDPATGKATSIKRLTVRDSLGG
ncbi:MAG: TIGR00282 family metallophosphoesterase [Acidobacteria bacterium]|nr:TIGR00282 family metallophosphoesterase [Acidobacteriota bacterium]